MKETDFKKDPDMEKELQEWMRAREMPVDENGLRQQYQNRLSNAQG